MNADVPIRLQRRCSAPCLRFQISHFGASELHSFTVTYKGHNVGEYVVDVLVEDVLLIELKCVDRLANEHTAQCLNYLRASGRTVCLLINFQKPKVEWKRIVKDF